MQNASASNPVPQLNGHLPLPSSLGLGPAVGIAMAHTSHRVDILQQQQASVLKEKHHHKGLKALFRKRESTLFGSRELEARRSPSSSLFLFIVSRLAFVCINASILHTSHSHPLSHSHPHPFDLKKPTISLLDVESHR